MRTRAGPISRGATGRILRSVLLVGALAVATHQANALSQIPSEEGTVPTRDGIISVPLPPLGDPSSSDTLPVEAPATAEPEAGPQPDGWPEPQEGEPGLNEIPSPEPTGDESSRSVAPSDASPLPVRYGDEGLPAPVRDLRSRLIEIARSGEIESLRPYLETGAEPTALAVQPIEDDPIAFLKAASGDGEGVEILAILLEVLLAGHVLVGENTPEAIHVWPYFTQVPLDRLTKPQLVELFELVTAGDYESMLGNGAYDFYRVGISPEGRLEFFLAGD